MIGDNSDPNSTSRAAYVGAESDVPEPTPEDMALDLKDHLINIGVTMRTDAVGRGWHSLGHHAAALRRAIHAEARIAALEAQLPETMKRCTIRFLECEKGHGRLTATNWVEHGCDICKIKDLEAERRKDREAVLAFTSLPNWENRIGPWKDVNEALRKLAARLARKETP